MPEMLSLEEAQELVLAKVGVLPTEKASLLDVVGRVCAEELVSDIDIAPFAHSAMDGFAVFEQDIRSASAEAPVVLNVAAEIAAGDFYEGTLEHGQCVRIMTGAPVPAQLDAVVRYEVVEALANDGKSGGKVAFSAPAKNRSNIREAGEEAKAGEVVVEKNEVISSAGVGFLAGCGILEVLTYARPRVAVISIGSELVPPTEVPTGGKIRNSNSYALAACVQAAGGIPTIFPIVEDSHEALKAAIQSAVPCYDCVVTSGGASNGDYDFIKPVVEDLGELFISTVNIRPGKAQTFGIVEGVPVFGLPGNPAAAFVGFEMIVRQALRKMQGYTHFERPRLKARLSRDVKKNDPRRIYLRSTLYKNEEGEYIVAPAKNQSSGLFGVIQRSNCMAIMPEGLESRAAGSVIECVLLDVAEELSI
ncbi:MAG: molybdopterin molybdotransferase MoeA [Coriobacteriaceae bacterium]|jgi:molybdopterin molybdotransferase|nr:molybdopterin molybdotransferase MoeA [Coriobacteriaceae bacterium]